MRFAGEERRGQLKYCSVTLAVFAIFGLSFVVFLVIFSVTLEQSIYKSTADSVSVTTRIDPIITLAVSADEADLGAADVVTGSLVTRDIVATVGTNSPSGYSLGIGMKTTEQCLRKASEQTVACSTIDTTGKIVQLEGMTEVSSIDAGRWGASLSPFSSYRPVPASSASVWTIKESETNTVGESTTIRFGAKVDLSTSPGAYSGVTVLSAVINALPFPIITSIDPASGAKGATVILGGIDLDYLYEIELNDSLCADLVVLDSASASCVIPDIPAGVYEVGSVSVYGQRDASGLELEITGEPESAVDFSVGDGSSGTVEWDDNMIPIRYTGTTALAEWVVADPTVNSTPGTSDLDWFDYDAAQWANAVSVTPSSLASYKGKVGTVVDEADVMGYWVYVPRYEYQVCRPNASDLATGLAIVGCPTETTEPYLFNIRFQKAGQKTSFDGITAGGWSTHPAFSFGDDELNGLWVGKFQNGLPDNSRDSAVYIKPGLIGVSGRDLGVNFGDAINLGAKEDGVVVDSAPQNLHNFAEAGVRIPRTNDWGAMAYLATSIYGRGTSEVWINNCVESGNHTTLGGATYNHHTGWAGASVSAGTQTSGCSSYNGANTNTEGAYHTAQGRHGSTTNNVYGVYDVSGANFDIVMGYYSPGTFALGFDTLPDEKFYDIFPSSVFNGTSPYNNDKCTWETCGGRAIHETKAVQNVTKNNGQSWNTDSSNSLYSIRVWWLFGGVSSYGTEAGMFSTKYGMGTADEWTGYRSVLW